MISPSVKRPQDAGTFLRLAVRAMENADVDADAVLSALHLQREVLDDDSLRTPHDAQEQFWSLVQEISGDPNIGIRLGEQGPLFQGHVLEYLFLSSPTFGTGLNRALRYQRLLSDAANVRLSVDDSEASLTLAFAQNEALRHLAECLLVNAIRFLTSVTDGAFSATRVEFVHPEPADLSVHYRVFDCPVSFSASCGRLVFDASLLDLPSSHAEPELLKLHERAASEQVAKLASQDIVAYVEQAIGEVLEEGLANLEVVSERLQTSPRELRSRLAQADTNFNQVLADYRCRLAKRLLAGTDESINQIVYLTGFSEPSTFYRAFKRWVGMTPVEYRDSKRDA